LNNELIIDSNQRGVSIAWLQDSRLLELHQEEANKGFQVGDVFFGRIRKIMPGLNAAFVDIGHDKPAFIHYHDLGPNLRSLIKFTDFVKSNRVRSAILRNFTFEGQIDKHGKINDVLKSNQVLMVQVVKEPIYLPTRTNDVDGGIMHPRSLIVIGANSSVTIIGKSEDSSSLETSMVNGVEEIVIGKNSAVEQYVLQNSGVNAVTSSQVVQQKNSRYARVTITLDGSFIRNNVNVRMEGEGCESNLYGYYHIEGENQVDNHTIIEHLNPNCLSNELYVGLLDQKSSGIFNGRVLVHQDAQQTNAFQSNKNILLSDNATMNTKPELEIYADDVKCSHGATIGQVDQQALFYLRSRGIPKQVAMAMLLQGFSVEVTDKIKDAGFRDEVVKSILEQLNN